MGERRRHIQPRFGPEKAFGEVLRQVRISRNLSQEKLGEECGSDRTFVSMLERGLVSPTLRTIVRVCRALKIAPWEMIRRTEKSALYRG